jgi:hypothetical protein
MGAVICVLTYTCFLLPSRASAKTSQFYECEKALTGSTGVAAASVCGVIHIIGPAGQVTGFGPVYYGAEQRATELTRAQAHCVSGFYAVAEDGIGC